MEPVPATTELLCLYVAHLAKRLKPDSIKQYLNVVRILHVECGFPNPCEDNYHLKSTLKGIERVKGNPVTRKVPVTP